MGFFGGREKRVPGTFFENFAVFEEIGGGLLHKLTQGSEQIAPPKVHFGAPSTPSQLVYGTVQ